MPRVNATSTRLRVKRVVVPISKPVDESFLWKTLNSSFFLWILSSLVISYGTWQYTQWKDAEQKKMEIAERIVRLDQEIEYRFGVGGVTTTQLRSASKATSLVITDEIKQQLLTELLSPPAEDRALFEKYAKRGTISLLKELSLLLDGDAKMCVEVAMGKMLKLKSRSDKFKSYGDFYEELSLIADYRWSVWASASDAMRSARDLFIKKRIDEDSFTPPECGANG